MFGSLHTEEQASCRLPNIIITSFYIWTIYHIGLPKYPFYFAILKIPQHETMLRLFIER